MSHLPHLPALSSCDSPAADLYYRRPGLWRVRNLLDPEGPDFTVKQMAAASGYHPSTIRGYLKEFERWGIVERLDTTTWRALDAEVDPEVLALAVPFAESQRRRHINDRLEFVRPVVDQETGEILNRVVWSQQPLRREPHGGASRAPSDLRNETQRVRA